MNVEQLDRIWAIIQNIRAELQTDPLDTAPISDAVDYLEDLIGDILGYLERTVTPAQEEYNKAKEEAEG